MPGIGGKADEIRRKADTAKLMSGFGGKADASGHPSECLQLATSGHSATVHSDLRQLNLLPFSASSRCYPGNIGERHMVADSRDRERKALPHLAQTPTSSPRDGCIHEDGRPRIAARRLEEHLPNFMCHRPAGAQCFCGNISIGLRLHAHRNRKVLQHDQGLRLHRAGRRIEGYLRSHLGCGELRPGPSD